MECDDELYVRQQRQMEKSRKKGPPVIGVLNRNINNIDENEKDTNKPLLV